MLAPRPIVALALAVTLAGVLCAHPARALGPHRAQKRDAIRQIQDLEEQWRNAQLTDDVPTMERLLSEDYVGIGMNSMVNTKGQLMARLRNRAIVLNRIDLSDVKVKLVGAVAIVTCRAELQGVVDNNPVNGLYRYTRVYQRLPNGVWKITNFEATRIRPGGPGSRDGASANAVSTAPVPAGSVAELPNRR